MASGNTFLAQAAQHGERACRLDKEGKYDEARISYSRAAEHYIAASEHEPNTGLKQPYMERAAVFVERAEQLKSDAAGDTKSPGNARPRRSSGGESASTDGTDAAAEGSEIHQAIMDTMIASPGVAWDDIAGMEETKRELKSSVILPLKHPELFKTIGAWNGFLLFGPPGTGKSMFGRAVATQSGSAFFDIKPATIMQKYLGASEKYVEALFACARSMRNAIIFIDEVDALFNKRSDTESDSVRRIKTQFLTEMSQMNQNKSQNGHVMVLAATNLPWGLDTAFQRRFEKRIYVGMPDGHAREVILRKEIVKHISIEPSGAVVQQLVAATDGLSGSDITTACRDARMEPVRIITDATHYRPMPDKKEGRQMWTPCSPGHAEAVEKNYDEIEASCIEPPPLSLVRTADTCLLCYRVLTPRQKQAIKALTSAKRTVAAADVQRFDHWIRDGVK